MSQQHTEEVSSTNATLIRNYLEVTTPGSLQLDRISSFLADDVTIDDPLMSMSGADAYIAALSQTPTDGGMRSTVQDVVADGDVVAARVLFEAGDLQVQFAQWFWVENDVISKIQVVYDPRPFLGQSA